jgi:hypothetical protein
MTPGSGILLEKLIVVHLLQKSEQAFRRTETMLLLMIVGIFFHLLIGLSNGLLS